MVTPIRPLAQVFPTVDPVLWVPVIVVVVTILTALVYTLVSTDQLEDRATLLLALIVGVTFIMPTSQDLDIYLVYAPLVVLLYTERDERVHWLYTLGALAVSYNVGRGQLRTVTEVVGTSFSEAVMVVGEPVLAFASVPLWGLFLLFAGTLVGAWTRGQESGRIDALRRRVAGDE